MQQLLWCINNGFWIKKASMLNIEGADYRCITYNMSRSDAINRLDHSKLDDKKILNFTG